MQIRIETPNDIDSIHALLISTFDQNPESLHTEHQIVDSLRSRGKLALSLVAIENDDLIGFIGFSQATINDTEQGWYLLSPLAVRPDRQGLGIGSELIQSGIQWLRINDASGVCVVGDPLYFDRFGFREIPELKPQNPPSSFCFLARPLIVAPAYGTVSFDASFTL